MRPQVGAIINLGMYWGLGLPFSCFLAFKCGLGAMGLWTGLACTASLQSVYLSYIVFRCVFLFCYLLCLCVTHPQECKL